MPVSLDGGRRRLGCLGLAPKRLICPLKTNPMRQDFVRADVAKISILLLFTRAVGYRKIWNFLPGTASVGVTPL
jgi:hypothetical protein